MHALRLYLYMKKHRKKSLLLIMVKAQRNIITNKKSMNIKDTFHSVKD